MLYLPNFQADIPSERFSWKRLGGSIDRPRSKQSRTCPVEPIAGPGTRCPGHLGLHPYYIPAQ